ncbi:MAG: FAD-binding oxidoreductase [Actinomycetia bacterium]|nr:FAD-binding oxidoreductase [Actinomycetes bacterium]
MDEDASKRTPIAWDAWGDPARAYSLPDQVRTLISEVFHVDSAGSTGIDEHDVRLRPSELGHDDFDALTGLVGDGGVTAEDADRLRHAGGKSTSDLLRRQSAEQDAPDAIVVPPTHDAVTHVLAYCAEHAIAVVPYGGGTSVVGGLDPVRTSHSKVIALDLRRLDDLESLDRTSGLATLGAGLTGPQAEALLNAQGFTLGHFPQSFEYASIGGFAATRSSGQASSGYGRFDDMVQALTVATPSGTLRLGRAPASAAGPDLRQLFLGSEGTLGVITDVTVRVHERPEHTEHAAWSFPDFAVGVEALRTVVRSGARPTVLRLADEAETATNRTLSSPEGPEPPCLAIATFEGSAERAARELAYARDIAESLSGTWLGADPAIGWEHGRFDAPYLRDALLRAGVLAETLETATTWSNLSALRTAVTDALTTTLTALGTPPLVMCHVSHTYATGASLYFTIACAQADDPITQWAAAKRATGDAIIAAGGTISHHHAVGADHRAWMRDEIGDLGVDVLRAVKNAVDPAGVLNPGKLLPE